jgi:hypothetical protein
MTLVPMRSLASGPLLPARRGAALRRPAAVALVAVMVVLIVATVDPEESGHYPTCPFLALTGHWCPGCGSLRAIHALAHGQVATAASRNVLTVAALPLLGWLWLRWVGRSWRGEPRPQPARPVLVWALLALVLVFWLVRNLSVGAALAP